MQLYYHPYGCSLAPAIVASEAAELEEMTVVEPHGRLDDVVQSLVAGR